MANHKYTGNEGAPIEKETAERWMKNYEKKKPNKIKGHFYGKDQIKKLIDNPESKGIRVYYAKDDFGGDRLVLVGVAEDGTVLWPGTAVTGARAGSTYIALDYSQPCPPYC